MLQSNSGKLVPVYKGIGNKLESNDKKSIREDRESPNEVPKFRTLCEENL